MNIFQTERLGRLKNASRSTKLSRAVSLLDKMEAASIKASDLIDALEDCETCTEFQQERREALRLFAAIRELRIKIKKLAAGSPRPQPR